VKVANRPDNRRRDRSGTKLTQAAFSGGRVAFESLTFAVQPLIGLVSQGQFYPTK
jgi:hypothetical protein